MTGVVAANPEIKVYISAGSNIDPVRHLRDGCHRLEQEVGPLELSAVYRTAAVGFEGDAFLNLVFAYTTSDPVEAVVATLAAVESAAGRLRGSERFSSRTLDFDLLMYGDLVVDRPGLKLPRDGILKYAFVLAPLANLAPDLVHPVACVTMRELWAAFDPAGQAVTRLDEPLG